MLRLSTDGRMLFSGSSDGTVCAWDVGSAREQQPGTNKYHAQDLHSESVTSLVSSGDASIFFSGSRDGTILVWERNRVRPTGGNTLWVSALAVSTDGSILFYDTSDKTIQVWDVTSGRELRQLSGHTHSVNALVLGADGSTLFSGSDDSSIRMWDFASGKEMRRLDLGPTPTGRIHHHSVRGLALSADGSTLFSGSMDSTVRVWEVGSGRELRRLKLGDSVGPVALSADGTKVFAASYHSIYAWAWGDDGNPRELKGHSSYIRALLLSKDGRTLFSGSEDATIRAWDIASGACVATSYADAPIFSLALAFDRYLAVGDGSGRVSLFKYDANPECWDSISSQRAVSGATSRGEGRSEL